MIVFLVPATIAVVAGVVWASVAYFVHGMVTWKPRRRSVEVLEVGDGTVTLSPGRFAEEPGEYVLVYADGRAQLGHPMTTSTGIVRHVISSTAPIPLGSVRISPDPDPKSFVGGEPCSRTIPTPAGSMPAWEYGPDSTSWAIHVHGVRSSRHNALWAVRGARAAGYRSLVIAYRGAPDGQAETRPAGLGYLEAGDVAAAVDHAVRNGAERIVLIGWSMGASAALLTTEQSPHRDLIDGLILIAPTVSWRHIMRAGARRMRVPTWITGVVAHAISSPLARAVGMPGRVDLDALDWVTPRGRLRVPTLVFTSRGDTNVPHDLVHDFARANPGYVRIHDVRPCTHGWEPNVDPIAFTRVLEEQLRAFPSLTAD